jgi:hypothetical protein
MLRTRIIALSLLLAACDDDPGAEASRDAAQERPLDAGRDASLDAMRDVTVVTGEPDAGPTIPARAVDVLFVIDNSRSMVPIYYNPSIGYAQTALAREIPRFLEGLQRGELDGETFAPVTSLHVGVVTSNAGTGLDYAVTALDTACRGFGDDGLLQTSTDAARDGYTRMPSFSEDFSMATLEQEADPACALGPQPRYQELGDGLGSALAASCVARAGVLGCGHEQTLEAMWKALAPGAKYADDELYQFATIEGKGGRGHGDGANAGFLREDATLLVVVLSNDDDCSVTSEGRELFLGTSEALEKYGIYENIRCEQFPELLRPVDRYARGLLSLKPGHPERIVFTAIVGVPASAVQGGLEPAAILALDEMKGDVLNGIVRPVCEVQTPNPWRKTNVSPGRRFVELAGALGGSAVLGTVCADYYRDALARTAEKL